jgi:ubiquinone biosynthesis protein COQ9
MTEPELIEAVVARAGLEGWNAATLRAVLIERGEDPVLLDSHFPRGAVGVIADWCALVDARMDARRRGRGPVQPAHPRPHPRVIELRLRLLEPDREAVREAVAALALPWNIGHGLRITARTASAMWYAAGDHSADFSWYSRRLTLGAVYSATLIFWLSPRAPDLGEVLAFLDRRLADIAPRRRTTA